MIGLRELTAGIAEYLAAMTGLTATNCRAESPVLSIGVGLPCSKVTLSNSGLPTAPRAEPPVLLTMIALG